MCRTTATRNRRLDLSRRESSLGIRVTDHNVRPVFAARHDVRNGSLQALKQPAELPATEEPRPQSLDFEPWGTVEPPTSRMQEAQSQLSHSCRFSFGVSVERTRRTTTSKS